MQTMKIDSLNFVEIKKANLDKDVSVSHLSYIGDAEIGENVKIINGVFETFNGLVEEVEDEKQRFLVVDEYIAFCPSNSE